MIAAISSLMVTVVKPAGSCNTELACCQTFYDDQCIFEHHATDTYVAKLMEQIKQAQLQEALVQQDINGSNETNNSSSNDTDEEDEDDRLVVQYNDTNLLEEMNQVLNSLYKCEIMNDHDTRVCTADSIKSTWSGYIKCQNTQASDPVWY